MAGCLEPYPAEYCVRQQQLFRKREFRHGAARILLDAS
jgi:hypothetical protein